jgi:hypothetical protein
MFLGLLKKMNLAIEEDEFGSCLKLSLAVGGVLFWEGFVVCELRVLCYHYNLSNGHKLYQIAINHTKWPFNMLTSFIARPSKLYPNRDFWFENMPSGNPACMFHDGRFKNKRKVQTPKGSF